MCCAVLVSVVRKLVNFSSLSRCWDDEGMSAACLCKAVCFGESSNDEGECESEDDEREERCEGESSCMRDDDDDDDDDDEDDVGEVVDSDDDDDDDGDNNADVSLEGVDVGEGVFACVCERDGDNSDAVAADDFDGEFNFVCACECDDDSVVSAAVWLFACTALIFAILITSSPCAFMINLCEMMRA